MFVEKIVPKFPGGVPSQDIHTAPVVRGDSGPGQAPADAPVITTPEDTAPVVTDDSGPSQDVTTEAPVVTTANKSDSELNVISSEEDTNTNAVVEHSSSSKTTLTSDLSSSGTYEEIATGMADPIITVIEPMEEPPKSQPETPRCKVFFIVTENKSSC